MFGVALSCGLVTKCWAGLYVRKLDSASKFRNCFSTLFRSWSQEFGLGFVLGLEDLVSFDITAYCSIIILHTLYSTSYKQPKFEMSSFAHSTGMTQQVTGRTRVVS